MTTTPFLDESQGPHPTIGLKAKRGCTDCWCLLIFVALWGLMIAVAIIAFDRGDPMRLLYGTDYLGNVCGQGDAPSGYHIPDWGERTLLWYPITYDPVKKEMIVTTAIDLGICVQQCPTRGDIAISSYTPIVNSSSSVTVAAIHPTTTTSQLQQQFRMFAVADETGANSNVTTTAAANSTTASGNNETTLWSNASTFTNTNNDFTTTLSTTSTSLETTTTTMTNNESTTTMANSTTVETPTAPAATNTTEATTTSSTSLTAATTTANDSAATTSSSPTAAVTTTATPNGTSSSSTAVTTTLATSAITTVTATAAPPTFGAAAVTYPILFNSAEQLYRCVPDFMTFDCANVTDCLATLEGAASKFDVVNDAMEFGREAFREIVEGWWVILVGVLSGVILSFLWVLTLRRTVKPIVVIFILLVLALLIGGGVACFFQMKSLKDDATTANSDAIDWWMAGAIILWGIAFICLCVLVFIGKSILTACDVIEEAAKVPIAIPTMNALPLFIFVGSLPFAAFMLAVAVYIQSCGDILTVEGYRPVYVEGTDFSNITALITNASAVSEQYYEAHTFVFQGWRVYAHLYNLFIFLWTFGVLNAIGYLTFALCNVFWYWSKPGDNKQPPLGSVCIAVKIALRYHLGSLALGAFIVAIVQLMRVVLVLVSKQAKETGADKQAPVKFAIRCLQCCLACLERVIKFINKNAYIVMAHDGNGFVSSAQLALDLITGNALLVGFTNIIAELFLFFGKFQIALFAGGVTFLLTHYVDGASNGISKGIILIFIVTLISYLVATLFLSVLECCVDSILICFCYDKIYSEVDYFPQDLAKHIDVKVDESKVKQKSVAMADAQHGVLDANLGTDKIGGRGSDYTSSGGRAYSPRENSPALPIADHDML